MLQDVRIENISERDVVRLNYRFPAGQTIEVGLDTDSRDFKQIKACRALKVIEFPVALEVLPTVLKVTPESEVVPPVVVTKVVGDFKCPYCAVTSLAAIGITSHVRFKHPDLYEEFKAGAK